MAACRDPRQNGGTRVQREAPSGCGRGFSAGAAARSGMRSAPEFRRVRSGEDSAGWLRLRLWLAET